MPSILNRQPHKSHDLPDVRLSSVSVAESLAAAKPKKSLTSLLDFFVICSGRRV
ncbi:hypothetical protein FPOAC1_000481 [Fusarium poae]|uniref:hypothetical protein n=1 Tax=Fusarium poae TaxID=36050 RepID=UPI001CE859A4|nr:hypothetical protein FPOAC1_000481 [Fusarium poae]KAG8674513.1 hypothetical protein FPOAC1_000481 [Fusarium poae]